MPSERKVTWKMVRSVAKEMGLKCKRLGSLNSTSLNIKGLDPDIAYFVDKYRGKPIRLKPGKLVDGLLYYKKRRMPLCLSDSVLSPTTYIRKFLHDGPTTCDVCFEEVDQREEGNCKSCLFRLCPVCTVKNALTERNVTQILNGQFVTHRRCPGCRHESDLDSRSDYPQVLDRLDMFTERQQEALLNAKRNDPHAVYYMTLWVEKHPLRYYKKGVMVELHGLKSRPNWNGKIARIIGEGEINGKDQFRWPIMLKDSKQKALLLQNNMMPMEEDVGSDGREFYMKHFPNPSGIDCCEMTPEFVMHQLRMNQHLLDS